MKVYERLTACGNDQYRDFQSKFIPNIPKETMLGVNTPDMRRIAREIRGTEESVVYIEERRLSPWIHKKAIQKAIESFRVSDAHKEYLKTLR